MPKKKIDQAENPTVQVVVRLPKALHDRLLQIGRGLGLDFSNTIRLVLSEKVGEYLARADQAARLVVLPGESKPPASSCDVCSQTGRLHRLAPGDWGNGDGTEDILLCDDCFEARTDEVAECQDCCTLPPDHHGECR